MSNHLRTTAGAPEEESLSDIVRNFKKFIREARIAAIKEVPEGRRDWLLKEMDQFKMLGEFISNHRKPYLLYLLFLTSVVRY